MPTLVIVRHAQAEPSHGDDHSRVLSARGIADCVHLGHWLREAGVRPDRVLVSTALRTRQTWEFAGVDGAGAIYADGVYDASLPDLLTLIHQTPGDVQTLVVVGHAPGVSDLVWSLDNSPAAREWTDRGMGTAAAALVEVASWADLERARLVRHT